METAKPTQRVYFGDNLPVLRSLAAQSVDLVYTDPPFNTGKEQRRTRVRVETDAAGERAGFGGRRYRSTVIGTQAFADAFDDYLAFLEPRLREVHRVLRPTGSLYLHLDYREVHYCKVLLDEIFGRACFINEIVWAYDFGGRPKRRWPAKHDTILFYAKDAERYTFNVDAIDRIPYMAPGLVGPEKAAKGKLPTDTWWHTIVGTGAAERTGYPTQKPEALSERILRAGSNAGELVLDPFAGSGTVGVVASRLGRRFVLVDENAEAVSCMRARLGAGTEYVEVAEMSGAVAAGGEVETGAGAGGGGEGGIRTHEGP